MADWFRRKLASPHNDWFATSHKLPLGSLKPDATVAKLLQGLVDADQLTKLVQASSQRSAATPEYRKALQSRTMQEQLRPLFCAVELNIESDRDPFDQRMPAVKIPAGFFADQTQTGAARPSTPKNHRHSRFADPAVVPTFGGRLQRSQILRSLKLLESAKLG
jgi:hypothetical protein